MAPESLQKFEEELVKQVPLLLEQMNDAAAKTNQLELELSQAQATYKQALSDWSRHYHELRARYGGGLSGAIDYARPYFDALERCQEATGQAEQVRRRYSAARQQMKEAMARVEILKTSSRSRESGSTTSQSSSNAKLQQEVKVLRADYEIAMLTLQRTKEELQQQRAQVDASTIERARPCFKALQKVQLPLNAAHQKVAELSEQASLAKSAYRDSLKELDRISEAIHKARGSSP